MTQENLFDMYGKELTEKYDITAAEFICGISKNKKKVIRCKKFYFIENAKIYRAAGNIRKYEDNVTFALPYYPIFSNNIKGFMEVKTLTFKDFSNLQVFKKYSKAKKELKIIRDSLHLSDSRYL